MVVFGFVFGTIGHFLPLQKELAILVGSGVTYNVLTSDPAKALGNKALIFLNKKIDSALESEDNTENVEEKEKESENSTKSSGQVQQSGQST